MLQVLELLMLTGVEFASMKMFVEIMKPIVEITKALGHKSILIIIALLLKMAATRLTHAND